MVAGQTLSKDGNQVLLFPLPYIYISQGEGGSYSHAGTLNIDFLGYNGSQIVNNQDYYAPCDIICKVKNTTAYYCCWESVNEVWCADGVLRKISIMNIHGDYLPDVGTIIRQGEKMGVTGSYGQASGDHVHLNFANGAYAGQEQVPPDDNWELKNSNHIYDLCYVNDTGIIVGYGYDWKTYIPPSPPGEFKKNHYKFNLFSKQLKDLRN